MSGNEREAILRYRRITPSHSEEWELHYKRNTVVFLFDVAAAEASLIDKIPRLHYDNFGETWILEFDSDIVTESDTSQSTWLGAVVFRGTILSSQISNVTWESYRPSD